MKRKLDEQLNRMKKLMTEAGSSQNDKNFIKSLKNKEFKISQKDDPQKADYVGVDVKSDEHLNDEELLKDFYNTLDNLDKNLTELPKGGIPYQKEVETVQIGLQLLGYSLPKYGVDGKFGPETADAVTQFKKDNNINENKRPRQIIEAKIPPGCSGKLQLPTSSPTKFGGGPNITIKCNPLIIPELQQKILRVVSKFGEPITLTSCYRESGGAECSQHFVHKAVDLVLKNKTKDNVLRFVKIASEEGLTGIGVYDDLSIHIDVRPNKSVWGTGFSRSDVPLWAKATMDAHMSGQLGDPSYNIASVSEPQREMVIFTPQMADMMSDMLKSKGTTAKQIKNYLDPINFDSYANKEIFASSNIKFTDLDLKSDFGKKAYEEICNEFIRKYPPNKLGITGKMMANAAANAQSRHGAYVPPELALAQLRQEGGIGDDRPNIRPIRTKNPFNINNVDIPKGETDISKYNQNMSSVTQGIQAYYDLVAKNYLSRNRSPYDLLRSYVNLRGNRYASDPNYEKSLRNLIQKNGGISDLVMNKLGKNLSGDTV